MTKQEGGSDELTGRSVDELKDQFKEWYYGLSPARSPLPRVRRHGDVMAKQPRASEDNQAGQTGASGEPGAPIRLRDRR
jgi:hypothetical protein